MQVGIYCSSNKPHLWGSMYQTLSQNDIDFNLCIAGPNPPVETLPSNVKHIQTNVKPAQCYFVASYNTTGDYIMHTPDDVIFSPGYLDNMVKLINCNKMSIVSPGRATYGNVTHKTDFCQIWDARGYPDRDPRATYENRKYAGLMLPLTFPLPLSNFMRRETFNSIGIDKNFIGMWWTEDISMELVSKGWETIVSETSYGYDFRYGQTSLCQMPYDVLYFNNMWIDQAIIGGPDKKVRTARKEPIDPLVYNETVLTVSQGRVYPPPLERGGTYETELRTNIGSPVRMIPPSWI